jgi:hypothetical protein
MTPVTRCPLWYVWAARINRHETQTANTRAGLRTCDHELFDVLSWCRFEYTKSCWALDSGLAYARSLRCGNLNGVWAGRNMLRARGERVYTQHVVLAQA